MNDQDKKKNGKGNLEDLLGRSREGRLEDDFEKEAAEGFRMLGDEATAKALKAGTDRKLATLFQARRRKRAAQWSMAAGVLLLVSMTVYFLKDNVTEDKQVVQTDIIQKQEKIISQPQVASEPIERPVPSGKGRSAPRITPQRSTAEAGQELQFVESANVADGEKQAEPMASSEAEAPLSEYKEPAPLPPQDKTEEMAVAATGGAATEKDVPAARADNTKAKSGKKQMHRQAAPSSAFDMSGTADDAGAQLGQILKKKLPASLQQPFVAIVAIKGGVATSMSFVESAFTTAQKREVEKTVLLITPEEFAVTGIVDGEIRLTYYP